MNITILFLALLSYNNLTECLVHSPDSISLSDASIIPSNHHEKANALLANRHTMDSIYSSVWPSGKEGGIIYGYFIHDTIQLIQIPWSDESGIKILEFFFEDHQLFLVKEYTYLFHAEQTSKKIFDEYTEETIDTYYFLNEQLVLWIDSEGEAQDLTMGTNSLVGKGLVSFVYWVLEESLLKEKAKTEK